MSTVPAPVPNAPDEKVAWFIFAVTCLTAVGFIGAVFVFVL